MRALIVLLLCLLLVMSWTALAQDDACPLDVAATLAIAATSCDGMEADSVCFGHAPLDTVINCDEPLAFAAPGDMIPLNTICALRSGPMSAEGDWGVGLMRVPVRDREADLTFVVLGDVEMQNAASVLSEKEVWVARDTEILNGPGSQYEAIAPVTEGTVLRVNACNCTGNWLRVVLEDGQVGWISAISVTILGDVDELPVVSVDTPVYASFQNFVFRSPIQPAAACSDAPADGVLIQAPTTVSDVPVQINGVALVLNSTIFVQSQPGEQMRIQVLDGLVQATVDDTTVVAPAGTQVMIPVSDENTPAGMPRIAPYTETDVANLPVNLLPEVIDPTAALNSEIPLVVGVPICKVISATGDTNCPVYFVNPDGDAIQQMNVEFVYAAMGEWTGRVYDGPELLEGDTVSGALAWKAACTLGSANFIGPVVWSITITDEHGHVSEPFEASFNCAEG